MRKLVAGGVCWLFAAAALADPRIELGSASAQPGQTVTIQMRLTNGAACYAGVSATIQAPDSVSLSSVTRGALLANTSFSLFYQDAPAWLARHISVVAVSASNRFTDSGALLSMALSVSSNAIPGEYPLRFLSQALDPAVNSCHSLAGTNGVPVIHTVSDGWLSILRPASPEDSNGNGIPDAWEIAHFGVVTNVSNTTDYDGDGLSDYYEWLAGTNPKDDQSCVMIEEAGTESDSNRAFFVTWYSIANRTYRIERSCELTLTNGFTTIVSNVAATPPLNTYADPAAPGQGALFYRVVLEP